MQFDIRRFDIYRKIPKDLTQPTLTGACISVCSVLFIIYLLLSEFISFVTVDIESELSVEDPIRYSQKIPVFLNITIPKLKCEYLGLDIQDDLGRHEVGFRDNTHKTPVENDEGCRMESHFMINKVPGNFHVSTHSSRQQPGTPDMTHLLHKIRFGMDMQDGKEVKGSFNPLENVDRRHSSSSATHDYILKIVPTVYEDIKKVIRFPFQYTYSYREVQQHGHSPAIWFRYDMGPITVRYKEKRKPLYHFLTTVCAIVGGTFTVAGIIDSCIFTASNIIKKAELGKLS